MPAYEMDGDSDAATESGDSDEEQSSFIVCSVVTIAAATVAD